jgi:hypothetical protein
LRLQPIWNGESELPLTIIGDGVDGNGGNGGTILRNRGAGNGIEIVNAHPAAHSDNFIALSGFALIGDGKNENGGSGIVVKYAHGVTLHDLWVQDQRENGIYLEGCWGSALDNVVILRSRRDGLSINKQFNAGVLRRLKVFGSGRIYDATYANISIKGVQERESLGVRIEECDFSYAGQNAFTSWSRRNGSLVSIAVAGGVGTMRTSVPHGLVVGSKFSISGAPSFSRLNSGQVPVVLSTPSRTALTFAAPDVPNGIYNERTMSVMPAATGLVLDSLFGVVLENGYCEDPASNGIYIGRVDGFAVIGGYYQNALVSVNGGIHGSIAGAYFTGPGGGVAITNGGRNEVDLRGSNAFVSGATRSLQPVYKSDGLYAGAMAPESGTWQVGDHVRNVAPAVGQPKGWYCTVAGTPGTWVSEGNL